MSTPHSYFEHGLEHGAHFVLKGRILPRTVSTEAKMRAQNEHGAVRFHSCYFYYFLREYIDKMNKKVHNKFTNEYRHIQEHGSRGIRAERRETGCESPTQKRHCKV